MTALYLGNDMRVRWDLMSDELTGDYINDATVTFTLKDSDGDAVAGASAVSMPYVVDSDGRYQAKLAGSVALTNQARYFLEISASSAGRVGFRRLACKAQFLGV